MTPLAQKKFRWPFFGVLGIVLCASLWARVKQDQRMERLPNQIVQTGWFSVDADGLYHARRVARGLEEKQMRLQEYSSSLSP